MILIVTRSTDTTADYVLKRMRERNVPYFRLDTDTFGREIRIDLFFKPTSRYMLTLNNRCMDILKKVKVVWFRRLSKPEMPDIQNKEARGFAEQELDYTVHWLIDSLQCPIIDREQDLARARNKFDQLRIAQRLHLIVPQTLVTNNPKSAIAFLKQYPSAIVKSVAGYGVQLKNGFESIYTNEVTSKIIADIDSIKFSPACFQQKIEKIFEIRATIIGNVILTCKIDSQKSEKTKIDWRRYDIPNTPHSIYQLDKQLEEKLLRMVRHYNVRFASFDLIMTPTDKIVFLEMNAGSQFVWIEQLTGLPITDELITELLNLGGMN